MYFYDLTRPKHTCVNKLQVHLIHTQGFNGFLVSNWTQMTKIYVTAGSSISGYRCCLEPWRELVSIIRFLWYSYCMEEIKDRLKQTYTERYKFQFTRAGCLILPFFSPQNCFWLESLVYCIINCTKQIRIGWHYLYKCLYPLPILYQITKFFESRHQCTWDIRFVP